MRLDASIRPTNPLQLPGVSLKDESGREIAQIVVVTSGYIRVSESWTMDVAEQVAAALCDGVIVPDQEYKSKPPGWITAGGTTTSVRTRSGGTGEVKIPEGAKYLANGEIEVPPRRSNETPEEKKFRRACRKARNMIREAAAGAK